MPSADPPRKRSRKSARAAASRPFTEQEVTVRIYKGHTNIVCRVALPADGRFALTTSDDGTLRWWDLTVPQHSGVALDLGAPLRGLAVTADGSRCAAGDQKGTVHLLEGSPPRAVCSWPAHSEAVGNLAFLADGRGLLSAAEDGYLCRWEAETGRKVAACRTSFEHLYGVAASADGQTIIGTAAGEGLVRWDGSAPEPAAVWREDVASLSPIALSADGRVAVTGRRDGSVAVWDVARGQRSAVLEGHTAETSAVALTPDGRLAATGSADDTVRLWHVPTGRCLAVLKGHEHWISGIALTPDARRIASVGTDETLRVWDIPADLLAVDEHAPRQGYRCAKVVLVGESGAGKSGLALRMGEGTWRETGSTHGMEIRRLTLPGAPTDPDVMQEVWLWDLAGQTDFRLIHQLYMERTAVALLVVESQLSHLYTSVPYWQEALRKACAAAPQYVLVAARGDVSPLPMPLADLKQWAAVRGIREVVATAAAKDEHPGAAELLERIAALISWTDMTPHYGQEVFAPLKQTVLALRTQPGPGGVVVNMETLHQRVAAAAPGLDFTREDLASAVHILDVEGVVKRLAYGDLVLLLPEALNNYASAVVSMARADKESVGHVPLSDLRPGALPVPAEKRLSAEDEAQLLPALKQTFIERALAWTQETVAGTMLVLPGYATKQPPDAPPRPWQTVVYSFTGPLEEIYSTLVVRLRCSRIFTETKLFRQAAEFLTATQKLAALTLETKGAKGELSVHFAKELHADVQAAFQKFVEEHLKERALRVERVRNYFCPKCGEPAERRQVEHALEKGRKVAVCGYCDPDLGPGRIELMDVLEVQHASQAGAAEAKEMGEAADVVLSTQSMEQVMVGEVTALVAGANQILRSVQVRDEGVDAEIEFTNAKGRGTNIIVQLQLKAGDSHLKPREEKCPAFPMKPHYEDYWTARADVPVYVVVRPSAGEMVYTNATEAIHAARKQQPGKKVAQIDFDGKPFDKTAVLALRDEALRRAGKQ